MNTLIDAGWMRFVLVALGGALGAVARYGVYLGFAPRAGGFPVATLTINVCGCFLAGLLAGVVLRTGPVAGAPLHLLAGMGFLGAFTTFSTFGVETLALLQSGQALLGLANAVANCGLGTLAALAGWALLR